MVITSQYPQLVAPRLKAHNMRYMEMKDKIALRMRELRITQDELAEKAGLSQVSIHKILNGGGTRKLVAIARALQCAAEDLVSDSPKGLGEPRVAYTNTSGPIAFAEEVPLISYVQAGEWSEAIDLYEPGYAENFISTTHTHSKLAFALRVEGHSMTLPPDIEGRSFPPGMIIQVDPEKPWKTGDFVVARHDGNKVTFKRLSSEEGRPVLTALNPDRDRYPVIRDEFEVIGRVFAAGWEGL